MMPSSLRLEVFNNLVAAIAQEMGAALHRSAFSPNIKERRDHSCAVFDPRGRLVAQAEHIPVHLGSMPETVLAVTASFDLSPGDVVVLNDPFLGGTHLPDISMVSPVFHRDRLVALLASRAHHSDVGGSMPGSLGLASEIYQEGVLIPPTILVQRGRIVEDVERLICANVRDPRERRGDLAAQVGAHLVGERRVIELFERYGPTEVSARFEELIAYSSRLAAIEVSRAPGGVWSFTDRLDDDGFGAAEIPVSVTVRIDGDRMTFDFTGSSPAVEGPLNCPRSVTLSASYYVFRCFTGDHIPANHGAFEPLEVVVPRGCILDAQRPHAVGGGNVETSQRVVDTLLGALARAAPGRIPAASYGTMSNVAIGSTPGAGRPFSYYETIAGGTGGHPEADGVSACHAHMTNTLNTPVEALEYAYPFRVTEYSVRRGSGGGGLHRGGDGLVREIEMLEKVRVSLLGERRSHGPWGLSGGSDGKPAADHLVSEGKRRKLASKGESALGKGQRLRIETPGGGGWGKR